jgi:hypothetical protein
MRLPTHKLLLALLLSVGLVAFATGAWAQIQITEVRTDMTSTDTDEYFELKGPASTDLSSYTYIVIGDGTGACGVVECVVPLTGYSIQADGFFAAAKYYAGHVLTGYDADINSTAYAFENTDNVTHLLVSGWTGAIATDLDTNDDGTLDVTPWTAIIDGVALVNAAVVTCAGVEYTYYPSATLGPDGTYHPGHVYRCSDTGAWVIGQFALGIDDSPGAVNPTCLNPPPEFLREPRTPCVPFTAQTAAAQAVVLNAVAADIHYAVYGGSATTAAMSVVATSGDTTTFEYVLPAQSNNGDLVEYYVTAYNVNPDTTQGHNQGYFVGTKNIRDLYVNDVNGANIYRYYGARVTGNVTLPYGVIQVLNTDYNIQDATGGINVFKYGTHTVQPGLGDDVTVEGIIDQYNGKVEIATSATCDTLLVEINGPGSVPAAALTTTCSSFEAVENDLVRMMLVKFPVGTDTLRANTNYRVTNCYADTLLLRVDGDTNIPGMAATSLYANVIGIASQFDSATPFNAGYQLIPRFASDIEFVATTGIEDRNVRPMAQLLQNAPNPFGRSTEIRYQVPAGAKAGDMVPVTINVFDIRGRLVNTLVDALQTPGDHVISLSGDALRNAGSGIYFYRLETGGQVLTRRLLFLEQ